MHSDEAHTEPALVGRLVATQFPQWAELPIRPVPSAGTENALYRLGDKLVVRLPRIQSATGPLAKEFRWLPRLAPALPLAIPEPLARGRPGEGYPWHWSVYRWLEGESPTAENIADPEECALELARFILALQRIDAADGPPPGPDNYWRGAPLERRDGPTREAIATVRETFDVSRLTSAWEAALEAAPWDGPPVWIHGDLQSENLLVNDGRLRAVIDFGCLGVGDPACDVMAAWVFLCADTRDQFRAALTVDDDAWARGRGWALSFGLIAFPYYESTNPVLAGIARTAIEEVLADDRNGP